MSSYKETDVFDAIAGEAKRQAEGLELIPSENYVSKNVLLANGSILTKDIPKKVKKVIDVKTPSTREETSFKAKNLKYLTQNDEIKFIISDRQDFTFSIKFIKSAHLDRVGIPILFSPNLAITGLAEKLTTWILESNLPIIFQPQVHKLVREKPIYLVKRA